jgi:hypothetical protein
MYLSKLMGFIGLVALLVSCQGPEGAPGPTGAPGPKGDTGPASPETVALMYEVEFDLTAANQWKTFYSFPAKDVIYKEDVVLVYLFWEQTNANGQKLDVWRLMPVSYLNPTGTLMINFDFTAKDVRLFAEASFTLTAPQNEFRDLLARIVVVPADYSPNGRKKLSIDYTDYEQVKAAFGLPQTPTKKGTPFKQLLAAHPSL